MNRNNKGFTLAEMLIVVAIIGVLVAVTTTIILNSLERAREATDLINIRSAVAMVQDAYLSDTGVKPAYTGKYVNKYDDIKDTGMTQALRSKDNQTGIINYRMYVKLSQTQSGWQGKDYVVAGIDLKANKYQYDKSHNMLKVYITSDEPGVIKMSKDNFDGVLN